LQCAEAAEELATTATESVLKLECNINVSTNFMISGILDVSRTSEQVIMSEPGSANRKEKPFFRALRYVQ